MCNVGEGVRVDKKRIWKRKKNVYKFKENPHDNTWTKAVVESGGITLGGEIKDSRICFAVFVRAALDANPQAGILGGGTQLGNNRCQ